MRADPHREPAGAALALFLAMACRSDTPGDESSDAAEADHANAVAPARGPVLEGVTQLGFGLNGACALSDTGEVYCWGGAKPDAESFQWGSAAPLRVAGLSDARAIRGWGSAIGADGRAYEWGCLCPTYRQGEAPDPSFDLDKELERYPDEVFRWSGAGRQCRCTRRAVPFRIEGVVGYWNDDRPCFVLADANVTCLAGAPEWAPSWFEHQAWSLDSIVDVATWTHIECVLDRRGSVACLFDNTPWSEDETVLSLVWLDPRFRRPAEHLYAFSEGLCARLDDGTVECATVQTKLEDPDTKQPYFGKHFLVPGAQHPRDLDAREQLYIDANGKLAHYRVDRFTKEDGEFQYFWRAEPGPVTEPAVELGVGEGFSCVRTETGRVQCWGRNDAGQCGIGQPTAEPVETPTHVVAAVDRPTHPVPPLPSRMADPR